MTGTDDSALLRFYRRGGPDHRGRTLDEIRAFGTDRLEGTHDFIQWLFPLPEPSGANPLAPILAPADIDAFLAEPALREELRRSLDVMLAFYGLERAGTRVDRAASYDARSAEWLERPHNFLRISRILRSLSVLGCAAEARALLACLETVYAQNAGAIGERTLGYWQRATARGQAGAMPPRPC